MKKAVFFLISGSLMLNGCSTVSPITHAVSNTFASEDPCSNNARNIAVTAGALIGAGLGAVIGKATGGDKKAMLTGAALGAGAVGLIGWNVGKDLDQRRCELHKLAQRYQINLHATPITQEGGGDPIGLAINLPERNNGGHFRAGSDALTPEARRYFSEIARQYSLSVQLAALPPNATQNERDALRKQLADKKLVLIGHTDDTGNSSLNAELSERRAHAVARLFNEMGVPEANLLYQGAGETLPVADNRSAEGRQQNRRVEIIDVNNETALQLYLASRKPHLEFYRDSDDALPSGDGNVIASSGDADETPRPRQPAHAGTGARSKPVRAGNAAENPTSARPTVPPQAASLGTHPPAAPALDFGGKPIHEGNSSLSIGKVVVEEGGFSLFSRAYASDLPLLRSCNKDRPRLSGAVKTLKDGKVYAKNEHLPGLFGTTWADKVNGHLVVVNKVSILRDSAQADALPLVNIYANYDPAKNKNPQPTLSFTPQVNTYRGSKGLLYRMFIRNQKSLQCMDVLLPLNGGQASRSGLIIYGQNASPLVAAFQPKSL